LIDFDGTLLFVSHDRYFINRVATHVLELSENGSTLYLGDYDYYVEKKAEVEAIQTAEASTSNQEKENVCKATFTMFVTGQRKEESQINI